MPRDLPSLNAIRMFEVAARAESFTRAAEELNVTQGAVSRQIALLEEQLGCSLFERIGPKVTLNESGREYRAVVDEAMEIIRRGTARIRQGRDPSTIVVSILPSFASHWLMSRLPDLEQKHPGISLRLAASHRNVDFARERDIDVAIRLGEGNWSGLYVKRITNDRLVTACTPELATKINTIADLKRQMLLVDDTRYDEWKSWFKEQGLRYQPRKERSFDDTGVQIQAAIDGLGVILAREAFIGNYLASGCLVKPVEGTMLSSFQYFFVCPKERLSNPNIKVFHDWLLSVK